MVKKLNEEQLDRYISKYLDHNGRDKLCFSLSLENKKIQEWIENRKFAHLKKELQIYQNLEFGCLKEECGCHYIFFAENENSRWRIMNLIDSLIKNFKVPLIKCPTYNKHSLRDNNNSRPIDGQYNNCPLF